MNASRSRVLSAALLIALCVVTPAHTAGQPPRALETFDEAWRIVRDSHFDERFNGVDWPAVSAELRPRAAAATTVGELRAVIREMLGRLGQSHFNLIPTSGDSADDAPRDLTGTPGFDVRLVGRELIVVSVDAGGGAAAAGVRPGWKLTSFGDVPVAGVLASLSEALEPRLLSVEAWRLAYARLRGPSGTAARLTFEDGTGKAVVLDVRRQPEEGQAVTVGNLPTMFVRVHSAATETPAGRPVGVVGFNVWMTAIDPLLQRAVDGFRGSSGIVVDLRGNPGGLAGMLSGISGHFIDERKVLGVMKMRDNELRFPVNPRRVSAKGERVQPYAGPVAILVDALSGSASECFTGGMQSLGRVRVFGQRTMGQALPALFTRLPNGDVLIHAYGDFVTADGTRLEGRGVIPDQVVPLDRADLLAGRDRTLEAALAWIDSAGAPNARRNQ